jgi:uncharacterized protein
LRYWDSSAVVPLILRQESTARAREWLREDPVMLVWWSTEIECVSAIARIERERQGVSSAINLSLTKLKKLASSWQEVQPTINVKEQSMRLLRVHSLRSADALQLAAAFVASEYRPSSIDFVCLDSRLADAAQREGFSLLQ